MRNTCDILTYFGTGLRCVDVLLMYTFANLCVFLNVGGKIRPYFVQITQNKALFWNALFWNARKENINKTQTRTQTHFVTFVFVHVYMIYCFIYVGRKI